MAWPDDGGGRRGPADPGRSGGPGDDGVRRPTVFLQGGEVFASAEPTSVVTVLGSCVAVCLFDPCARVGGVNHYLLPFAGSGDRSARFGCVAMALLLERVLGLGARRADLRAKVFGGAGTLARRHGTGNALGLKNVELAVRALQDEGIPILGGEVGGERGRKLVFHVDDGAAWVRTL